MVHRLSTKGFDAPVVQRVISRLEGEGWIDDERFATELIRAKSGKLGTHRLRIALGRAGLDSSLIRKVLARIPEATLEAALRDACAAKIESLSKRYGNEYVKSEVGRGKLARFLLARGHDGWSVKDEIDRQLLEIRTVNEDD